MQNCMHGCMHGCMDACMNASMNACIHAWMHAQKDIISGLLFPGPNGCKRTQTFYAIRWVGQHPNKMSNRGGTVFFKKYMKLKILSKFNSRPIPQPQFCNFNWGTQNLSLRDLDFDQFMKIFPLNLGSRRGRIGGLLRGPIGNIWGALPPIGRWPD